MNGNLDIPILERPAFFDGQQLLADDLESVQAYHRELLWLHSRSLHNWGIATGYSVAGSKGESTVVLEPGFALDCQGRELILAEQLMLAVPAVAGASGGQPAIYYLTASYMDDRDISPETREGTCGTSGAVRLPEAPRIRWQDPNDRSLDSGYRRGLDVVLAGVQIQGCQLAADVSSAERRNAMPEQQPFVFAGQTPAGATQWQLWPDPKAKTGSIGVSTSVSTTEAGFGSTPRYQAHVMGSRVVADQSGAPQFVFDGYAQVAGATAMGFELRVILPEGQFPFSGQDTVPLNPRSELQKDGFTTLLEQQLGWFVVWLGVEG